MERNLLKSAITLLLGGYVTNTNLSDDVDEMEKTLDIPVILMELSEQYKKAIEMEENKLNN